MEPAWQGEVPVTRLGTKMSMVLPGGLQRILAGYSQDDGVCRRVSGLNLLEASFRHICSGVRGGGVSFRHIICDGGLWEL